jgi:hypothetical protein
VAVATPPDAPPPPPPVPADAPVDGDAKKDASSIPVAHPAAEKHFGKLNVAIFPSVTVYFDNKKLGDSPNIFKVPVGKHSVRLENDSRNNTVAVTISDNQTTTLDH